MKVDATSDRSLFGKPDGQTVTGGVVLRKKTSVHDVGEFQVVEIMWRRPLKRFGDLSKSSMEGSGTSHVFYRSRLRPFLESPKGLNGFPLEALVETLRLQLGGEIRGEDLAKVGLCWAAEIRTRLLYVAIFWRKCFCRNLRRTRFIPLEGFFLCGLDRRAGNTDMYYVSLCTFTCVSIPFSM